MTTTFLFPSNRISAKTTTLHYSNYQTRPIYHAFPQVKVHSP